MHKQPSSKPLVQLMHLSFLVCNIQMKTGEIKSKWVARVLLIVRVVIEIQKDNLYHQYLTV
jgi:hypothetical protein